MIYIAALNLKQQGEVAHLRASVPGFVNARGFLFPNSITAICQPLSQTVFWSMAKHYASVHSSKCKVNHELANRETGSGLSYGCTGKKIKQTLHATFCKSFRASAEKGYLFIRVPIFVTWSDLVDTAVREAHWWWVLFNMWINVLSFVWTLSKQNSMK